MPRFAVAYHSNLDKEEVRQKEAQFTVNQKVVYNDCCGLPQCQTSKKGGTKSSLQSRSSANYQLLRLTPVTDKRQESAKGQCTHKVGGSNPGT